jgi:hypothetical protein
MTETTLMTISICKRCPERSEPSAEAKQEQAVSLDGEKREGAEQSPRKAHGKKKSNVLLVIN